MPAFNFPGSGMLLDLDESPPGSPARTRRFAAEFPLHAATMDPDAVAERLTGSMDMLTARQSVGVSMLSGAGAVLGRMRRPAESERQAYELEPERVPNFGPAQPEEPWSTGPRKPVTTLVSLLPPTQYKEKAEEERSDGYVSAQCAVLKFLEKNASDQLSPSLANKFTAAIDPKAGYPSAKEALRFCYYMRSQGFDTYARFPKGKGMQFFVATAETRGVAARDNLYWRQDPKSNYITEVRPSRHRPGRQAWQDEYAHLVYGTGGRAQQQGRVLRQLNFPAADEFVPWERADEEGDQGDDEAEAPEPNTADQENNPTAALLHQQVGDQP
ncbi:hypothetical protein CC80DRAFT_27456 [Byssothecium circinans]|uniref:Uncharacterized protein n=1 Tax=Byssothecium circinans TaxID=147558 RepID=A0A6A5U0X7_9PLEO|nr:hypothetical protein CC80DRAFT_27456 [Byssothecium circinans]